MDSSWFSHFVRFVPHMPVITTPDNESILFEALFPSFVQRIKGDSSFDPMIAFVVTSVLEK